jgi:uncharacterized protein
MMETSKQESTVQKPTSRSISAELREDIQQTMPLPGSTGEHQAQEAFGTSRRAAAFYNNQMLNYLNPLMRDFIASQEMFFLATADAEGACDCTFRGGPPGFVKVLTDTVLCSSEYRGNGVMAGLGNILENGHVGMIFVDFYGSTIGLHVNGTAEIVEDGVFRASWDVTPEVIATATGKDGPRPERWVLIEVEDAYIHGSKHIPLFQKLDKTIHWGTDNEKFKGGDAFKAKSSALSDAGRAALNVQCLPASEICIYPVNHTIQRK